MCDVTKIQFNSIRGPIRSAVELFSKFLFHIHDFFDDIVFTLYFGSLPAVTLTF